MKHLIIVFFLLINTICYSSDTIKFVNIDVSQMPELAYTLCMHKDTEGYMWFGTFYGLVRYNGSEFKVYGHSEVYHSLSNPVVHAITEDEKGNLWIGTENGLNKFDRETQKFTSYLKESNDSNGLSSTHIRTLYIDKDGIFWIGTRGGGLNRFDASKNTFKHYKKGFHNNTLTNNNINCITPQNDSIFWIGTEEGGLCSFNKNTEKFTTFKEINSKIIGSVYIDKNNTVWVGSWYDGLYKRRETDSVFTSVKLFDNNNWTARDIKEDSEGTLWIATFSNGLVLYNPQKRTYKQYLPNENSKNALVHSSLWSVYIDDFQLVWVGSFGNGVSMFDKYANKFNFITTNNQQNQGLKLGDIKGAVEDENGAIWFISNNGLFYFDNYTKSYTHIEINGKYEYKFTNIYKDKDGYLWLASDGDGLLQYAPDSKQFRYYFNKDIFPDFLESSYVTKVSEDYYGNIWFSVYEGGLFKISKSEIDISKNIKPEIKSFIFTQENPVIPTNIIWDIHFSSNNAIWLATNSGIYKFSPENGKYERYGTVAHSVIYSDRPGVLWIGSWGEGMGRIELSTKKVKYYPTENGLGSKLVQAISSDEEGNLWISTPDGISKFNPITESFKIYDESDGVFGKRFNVNAASKFADSKIFFGAINGYTIFSPKDIQDSPYTPVVAISDIKIFNKSIVNKNVDSLNRELAKSLVKTGTVTISSKDKMLTVDFSALYYSSKEHVQYAYKLEGFDKDWNYLISESPKATYTNLDGGTYLFKVKASNADGIWSNKITELKIVVEPPLWETFAFRFSVFLIIAALLILLIFSRYSRMKKRHAYEQLKKEGEIIKLKNEKLDAELELKNSELISKTLVLVHKNEKIRELKTKANDILHKISVSSQPKVYSLIKFIQKELENDQFWDQFEHQFNMTHNNFLLRFKEKYPSVTHKDLKLCAYIRMNLSNHEIASLLNVTYRGVEASRHRVRKKIGLARQITLNDYLLNF